MTTEFRPVVLSVKRRRFQYSLRELLIFTTIIAAVCSLLRCLYVLVGPDAFRIVLAGGLYLGSVAWLATDLRRNEFSGISLALFFVLFLVLGPIGVVFWLCMRSVSWFLRPKSIEYATSKVALAAASKLETDGDWNAAILLYAQIARRWPEHNQYARECLVRLEEKRNRAMQP